jgi:integrase
VHSPINIVKRTNHAGDSYYQARFFEKDGYLRTAKSYPGIQSRTEAYRLARKALEDGSIPLSSCTQGEIRTYGILTRDEVKAILSLEDDKPHILRARLIVLLGITCGLDVDEIRNLRIEDVDFDRDTLRINNPASSRKIPYIDKTRDLLNKMRKLYSDRIYVIPNLKDVKRSCDPITVHRGLSLILREVHIGKERNILPSGLQETFINLLLDCKTNVKTIDGLCGFDSNTDEYVNDRNRNAIARLMIVLEDLKYSPSKMNWLK